jgi:hypothetical protein
MHDEMFLVSKCSNTKSCISNTPLPLTTKKSYEQNITLPPAQGTVRFHIPGKPDIDAKLNDFVSVPIRAPHTFSNPHDVEAKFFNTYTPAFYINYFKLLGTMIAEGEMMTPEKNLEAMANYATLPVPKEKMAPVSQEDEKMPGEVYVQTGN